jgi:opacity protein-like surface antigen
VKKCLLRGVAIATLANAGPVNAGGLAPVADQYWSGFYGGAVAGAVSGQYDPRTSTIGAGYFDTARAATVTAAGTQTIKSTGLVSGIEGGYNWRSGNLLVGVEADLQAVNLNGAVNSGAIPNPSAPTHAITLTSYGDTDWLLTARPRIGFIASNSWLFYATGGLAATQLQTDFSFVNNIGAEESGRLNKLKAGYAVGGGVEAPLSGKLSIKADYLHIGFSDTAGQSTTNNLLTTYPSQVFQHSGDLKADLFRVGLNYHFGGPDPAPNKASLLPLKSPPAKAVTTSFGDWQLETGARLWLSTGTYGGPQPLGGFLTSPPVLVSRLTYKDLDALSGETFARADHVSGFFVKGYLGGGGVYKGTLNDEDFPAGNAYSNTLSSASGDIGYGVIDAGYNFLRAPGAKVGAFAGYSYYGEGINTYGCTQIAASNGSCRPPPGLPASLLGLTDYNHFNSFRVGLSSQFMLTDKLRLTADAAYLPWVNFTGLDDHLLRQLLLPEASNEGNGVMLEATLDYYVTPNWTVGVGGRYWAWNMNSGTTTFDFLFPPSTDIQTARFNAERYGAFVQTSYHWGEATPVAGLPTKALVRVSPGLTNWTGLYVGGHMGGGIGDARWSDPFGSTVGVFGGLNVAGFGDKTHATGPLGGGQIGANWQTGQWVLGAELDANLADLRGENTCFSGLGGINCQHRVNSLGSVTARVGYAFDRSLAYVKAGGAWTDTTYSLLGDTNGGALGTGSTSVTTWGWTAGIGVEYAVTSHWTTFAEYDHISLPPATVPFPTVAIISASNIAVTQSADLFKLGVNYKFDFGPWNTVAAKN